jgi:hypothetical protein
MNDPDQRMRLGRAGRDLVEREYGWQAIVQRLERFHERLLTASARGGHAMAVTP